VNSLDEALDLAEEKVEDLGEVCDTLLKKAENGKKQRRESGYPRKRPELRLGQQEQQEGQECPKTSSGPVGGFYKTDYNPNRDSSEYGSKAGEGGAQHCRPPAESGVPSPGAYQRPRSRFGRFLQSNGINYQQYVEGDQGDERVMRSEDAKGPSIPACIRTSRFYLSKVSLRGFSRDHLASRWGSPDGKTRGGSSSNPKDGPVTWRMMAVYFGSLWFVALIIGILLGLMGFSS